MAGKTQTSKPMESEGHDDALHRLIRDTAFEKFRRFGSRRVTMDEIARDLRISKKTLYQHYSTKADLVMACMDKFQGQVFGIIEASMSGKGKVLERLIAIQKAFSLISQTITADFITDLKSEFPWIWEEVDRRRHATLSHFESLYAEGVASGEFYPEIHPKVAVLMQLAIMEKVMNPDAFALHGFTPVEAAQTILTIMNKGLLSESAKADTAKPGKLSKQSTPTHEAGSRGKENAS